MRIFQELQTWAADRGYGQYPLPRSRPHVLPMSARLAIGGLSLFALAILIPLFFAEIVIGIVAIRAALGY